MSEGDVQPHLRHFLFLCTCWLFPYDGMGKPVMSGQLSAGKLGGFFSLLFCFLFLLLRFPLQVAAEGAAITHTISLLGELFFWAPFLKHSEGVV